MVSEPPISMVGFWLNLSAIVSIWPTPLPSLGNISQHFSICRTSSPSGGWRNMWIPPKMNHTMQCWWLCCIRCWRNMWIPPTMNRWASDSASSQSMWVSGRRKQSSRRPPGRFASYWHRHHYRHHYPGSFFPLLAGCHRHQHTYYLHYLHDTFDSPLAL